MADLKVRVAEILSENNGDYLSRLKKVGDVVGQVYPVPDTKFEQAEAPVLIVATGGTFACVRGEGGRLGPCPPGQLIEIIQTLPYFTENPIIHESVLVNLGWRDERPPHNFVLLEMNQPIDSSNASVIDWNILATIIYQRLVVDNRDDGRNAMARKQGQDPQVAKKFLYRGVVVIHGTDTLAYVASALSFMLMNTDLPVIITGSMKPVFDPYTDAVNNLVGACEVASWLRRNDSYGRQIEKFSGTYVFINNHLLIGTRVMKSHSLSFDAFESPNVGPMAFYRGQWVVNRDYLMSVQGNNADYEQLYGRRLQLICSRVRVLHLSLFPGIDVCLNAVLDGNIQSWSDVVSPDLIPTVQERNFVESHLRGYKGIIVSAFGTGNASVTIKKYLSVARSVLAIPVAVVLQCPRGPAEEDYETGITRDSGILLNDCSLPAAYAKLLFLLSYVLYGNGGLIERPLTRDERDRIEDRLARSLRGELSSSDLGFILQGHR